MCVDVPAVTFGYVRAAARDVSKALLDIGVRVDFRVVSPRVNYSFDQAFGRPALDQIALAPGSR